VIIPVHSTNAAILSVFGKVFGGATRIVILDDVGELGPVSDSPWQQQALIVEFQDGTFPKSPIPEHNSPVVYRAENFRVHYMVLRDGERGRYSPRHGETLRTAIETIVNNIGYRIVENAQ